MRENDASQSYCNDTFCGAKIKMNDTDINETFRGEKIQMNKTDINPVVQLLCASNETFVASNEYNVTLLCPSHFKFTSLVNKMIKTESSKRRINDIICIVCEGSSNETIVTVCQMPYYQSNISYYNITLEDPLGWEGLAIQPTVHCGLRLSQLDHDKEVINASNLICCDEKSCGQQRGEDKVRII